MSNVGDKLPLNGDFTIVDLSHALDGRHPRLQSDPSCGWSPAATFQRDGYRDFIVELQEHSGTHADAPSHFSADGADVADIPAGDLVGPVCVIDVRPACAQDPDYALSADDVQAWEEAHGLLPSGAFVAMLSGWDGLYTNPEAYLGTDTHNVNHFPGFSPDAAELIFERGCVALIVDTLSLDPGCSTQLPVHHIWLGRGRYGIENAANLADLPPTGAFVIAGLPKVSGSTGFPTRLIGLTPRPPL